MTESTCPEQVLVVDTKQVILPSSVAGVVAKFLNLTMDINPMMDDFADWYGADETVKRKIKIAMGILTREGEAFKGWVSTEIEVMGIIAIGFIMIIAQMKSTDNTIEDAFYDMLNACEDCNGSGDISEGDYLVAVNTTAKIKKIIDQLVKIPYEVTTSHKPKSCWCWLNEGGQLSRHLNIYWKPDEPVLAQ